MARKKKRRKKMPGAGFWLFLLCIISALSLGVRWFGLVERFPEEKKDFQMEVLNGTGRTGLAMKTAMELRKAGVDVLVVGDAEHYRFDESILVDRRGDPEMMKRLSRLTGCRRVILQVQREPLVDVTFVLGRDMIDLEIVD
ncbi:MAG: LytR C-terminal domain-containing protein [Candidatus Krumholzibacteria bacterium]|nr:LytR C-terminal domain-containing protein [Candidatus Krumholzibacteria bacterium]